MYSIEVYQDASGNWRWRLIAENGRIVADSAEGYVHQDHALDMISRIFDGAANVRQTAVVTAQPDRT